jgi:hypothetical protein
VVRSSDGDLSLGFLTARRTGGLWSGLTHDLQVYFRFVGAGGGVGVGAAGAGCGLAGLGDV